LFFVIASLATCPPELNARRRKQSILAKQSWIASHDPLRQRFAFVAGNGDL
jgi:hypothetical protein